MTHLSRRTLLGAAVGTAATVSWPRLSLAAASSGPLAPEIARRHDENVQRLQAWIREPCIAAESTGFETGVPFFMKMLRDAGFQKVEQVPTSGKPGVFATLDAGARKTLGLYFMYDVKQADPAEWSSPPFEGRLVDKPGFGKVLMGRGAVNQKGPESAFLSALHAYRAAKRKVPVNLVLVAEGEEEIGSPHFGEVVRRPEVAAALGKTVGVFMPSAMQDPDGEVAISLGAKGVVELELVASGARWGRGPSKDVHSANRARLDSPAFHLVQALATLVTPDGAEPAIDGFADRARPLSPAELQMVKRAASRMSEAKAKELLAAKVWIRDEDWEHALQRLVSKPTVNIEGLVAGYTGPGGKTMLPSRAVAKLDLRLVPDMTADGALAALKAHLQKRGFGDLEVNMSGGYDPTSTPADSPFVKTLDAAYRRTGLDPLLSVRNAGSWPGYLFTGRPLGLPAGHYGLGHGSGAHAPDEYFVVESSNPKVAGLDGAVNSYVTYLETLGA
ncbi:MAG TPA: M20/M25/M40 family metallo-hydrolase [Myxococcaceae bacterium]|nr:M20/M25/M40 family metallo-hydrolase [Myxococcaceae bacterium]